MIQPSLFTTAQKILALKQMGDGHRNLSQELAQELELAVKHADPESLCVCGDKRAIHYRWESQGSCTASRPNKKWGLCECEKFQLAEVEV